LYTPLQGSLLIRFLSMGLKPIAKKVHSFGAFNMT